MIKIFAKKHIYAGLLLLLHSAASASAQELSAPFPQKKPNAESAPLPNFLKQPTKPQPSNFMQNTELAEGEGRNLGKITEETPLFAPRREGFGSETSAIKPRQTVPLPQKRLDIRPQATPMQTDAAIQSGDYPLNETMLTKLEKIHAEILKLPELDDTEEDSIRGGIAVLVKALEKRPDIMGILGRNLMNASDYVTAMQACGNALAAASAAEDGEEEPIFGENSKISPENLAFGKKYSRRLRALLEE